MKTTQPREGHSLSWSPQINFNGKSLERGLFYLKFFSNFSIKLCKHKIKIVLHKKNITRQHQSSDAVFEIIEIMKISLHIQKGEHDELESNCEHALLKRKTVAQIKID